MGKRYEDREIYFDELAVSSRKYYIPYLKDFISIDSNLSVLEIGCGEGGNLLPFAEMGCKVMGIDIDEARIINAKKFFSKNRAEGTFLYSDIFTVSEVEEKFDLIIIHDVIEHIKDKEKLLIQTKKYLKPQGCVFIGFPPWYMPFGGHQQISNSRLTSKTPFIHLLPKKVYKWFLIKSGNRENIINELLEIKEFGISIEMYNKTLNATGYDLINLKLFFINPHYEIKFGLKPRDLNKFIGKIPFFRNFFSTSCWSLIKQSQIL